MSILPDLVPADVRAEIENLVHEHAWCVDNHQAYSLADLYTENGQLKGIRLNQIGPAAINAYGAEKSRDTGVTARHIVTNLRLVPIGDGRIRGTMCIALHRSREELGSPLPVALADATDTYALCADGRWRIEERRLELVFESEGH